jgi:hypothetical protein
MLLLTCLRTYCPCTEDATLPKGWKTLFTNINDGTNEVYYTMHGYILDTVTACMLR